MQNHLFCILQAPTFGIHAWIRLLGPSSHGLEHPARGEDAPLERRGASGGRLHLAHGAHGRGAGELLLAPGDRVALEGNNQKQADFLSRSLAQVDARRVHDLHLLISSISRPEHLSLFERGIARRVDFAFAGPQSLRVAQLLEDGKLEIGARFTPMSSLTRAGSST